MKLNPPLPLDKLAELAGRIIRARLREVGAEGEFELTIPVGGGTEIVSIDAADGVGPGGLTFAAKKRYLDQAREAGASAVIVPPDVDPGDMPHVMTPEPKLVFSTMLEMGAPGPMVTAGLEGNIRFKDPGSVELGAGVEIGDFSYIGARVKIGRGTVIHPQAYIDDDVEIGENCVLYPRVTLFRRVRLGRKVVVHTGAVIGDDGFGYNQIPDPDRGRLHHLKNVHVGGVVIEDFVEIGAQTTIDAGMVEPTRIGAGTKIDNQVQIAHNVSTGRDCIILAQVGVSGSCRLGDRVFLLGQAGLVDGASIGDDAIVLGKAGVTRDLPAGRKAWAGRPPHPADQEWKVKALARKELPRLRDFWRALKSADSIEELKNRFFGPDDRGDR